MPAVNVNIQPTILDWVYKQIDVDQVGVDLMEKISQWIAGTKTPTFGQVQALSRKSRIPLGYFFLSTPPEEDLSLLEFRTVDSLELVNPSRDLIDTMNEMSEIQDWMKAYRQEQGYGESLIVGSGKTIGDPMQLASKIREFLEIDIDWQTDLNDTRDAFNYIRDKAEECGIVVMVNGIVGNNTHRPLKINEFRAFAIADKIAPLIFINGVDSLGAKLFSLLHEIAHIAIGKNDLFNDRHGESVHPLEIICNKVAAEILVPRERFLKKWEESEGDPEEIINALAKQFLCSTTVIARQALECGKIQRDLYKTIANRAIESYIEDKEKRSSGGDYYNTKESKLDKVFVRAICESINSGRLSYTEAYRLTNTSRKTFDKIARDLGGVLW